MDTTRTKRVDDSDQSEEAKAKRHIAARKRASHRAYKKAKRESDKAERQAALTQARITRAVAADMVSEISPLWCREQLARLMHLAEENQDLGNAIRALEGLCKSIGLFTESVQVQLPAPRQYTNEERLIADEIVQALILRDIRAGRALPAPDNAYPTVNVSALPTCQEAVPLEAGPAVPVPPVPVPHAPVEPPLAMLSLDDPPVLEDQP